ncbi:MAG: Holliday junction resolvase RuvX [Vicinamibacterales bacterium]
MRVVAFDYGARRVGVAVSDLTGTLARPLTVLHPAGGPQAVLTAMRDEVRRLAGEEDGLGLIVLGLPRRLDGSPTEVTPVVEALRPPLEAATGLAVVFQDERLSSREAESRLALRERDWRKRKAALDAAAAAVILQDYLDARPGPAPVADLHAPHEP